MGSDNFYLYVNLKDSLEVDRANCSNSERWNNKHMGFVIDAMYYAQNVVFCTPPTTGKYADF